VAQRRFDFVSLVLVAVPLGGLAWLVYSGAFKPNGNKKGVPDELGPVILIKDAPSGAVDPAGFGGTQTPNGAPPGDGYTPPAGLGNNPPPVPASSDGSPATTWETLPPEAYQPGYPYYDQTWYRENRPDLFGITTGGPVRPLGTLHPVEEQQLIAMY